MSGWFVKRALPAAALLAFFAAVSYLLLFRYADAATAINLLSNVPAAGIFLLFLLTVSSLVIRTIRWSIVLRAGGIRVGPVGAFMPLCAGLSAGVLTPAKAGDIARCVALRKTHGIPIARSLPALIVERLLDTAVILLFAAAAVPMIIRRTDPLLDYAIIAGVFAILSLLLFSIFSRRVKRAIFSFKPLGGRLRFLERSLAGYSGKRHFLATIPLSFAVWIVEFIRLYAALAILGPVLPPAFQLSAIAAFSIIAGALSAMPGGLGVAEASLALLLPMIGIPKAQASAAIFLDRMLGFWPVLAAGAISYALVFLRRKRRR